MTGSYCPLVTKWARRAGRGGGGVAYPNRGDGPPVARSHELGTQVAELGGGTYNQQEEGGCTHGLHVR